MSAFPRAWQRYRERAFRYIHMECGHMAQNLLLQACALGLGAVPIGAFRDAELDALLGLDGARETTLYLVPVGVPGEGG